MNPEWVDSYLDYDKLKVMIDELVNAHVGIVMDTGKGASLSVARPTNAAGLPENQSTQEQFFSFIEQEIRKIDLFTKRMVRDIRQVLTDCESEANALASLPAGEARETATALLRAKMEACGEDFLKVRRFGSSPSPPPSPANLCAPLLLAFVVAVGEVRQPQLHGVPQDLEEARPSPAQPVQGLLHRPLARSGQ